MFTLGQPIQSLSQAADAQHFWREIRLAMEKDVERIKAEERRYTDYLIQNVPADSSGVMGLTRKAQVIKKPSVRVATDGWPAVYGFIAQTGRFDLLQRRLNESTALEGLEAGVNIPGLERFQIVSLSNTKV